MKNNRISFLDGLEKVGNFLPHPVVLFVLLIGIVIVASAIASFVGLSVVDPRDPSKTIAVINLMSMKEFVHLTTSLVSNFSSFPPLGPVLIAMLGVGVAEHSGFLSTAIRALVIRSPKKLITVMVVFAGIMSNLASDIGYVVLIPLAGIVFYSVGRHPLAGIAVAFAGVSGGFSANLFIGTLDPILAGLTQQSARLIDPNYVVGVEANWYFMFASTFLIVLLGYFVTEKIIEPHLGEYHQESPRESIALSALEQKGLVYALFGMLAFIALVALCIFPESSPFRNARTGSLIGSPFFKGIIFFVFFGFVVPGVIYGFVVGTFKNLNDVFESMAKTMQAMGMYLVIIFFVAQFLALFSWSNFGSVIAIKGANFLKGLDLDAGVLLIGFVLISATINLFIASASAQWALISPIFVPMLMLLGYSPEVIQAAYRIGDSVTNIITPLLAYLPVILVAAMKYKKDIKMGTMISMMFPYSMVFLLGWCALLYIWVFVFGLPVGPGSAIWYKASL